MSSGSQIERTGWVVCVLTAEPSPWPCKMKLSEEYMYLSSLIQGGWPGNAHVGHCLVWVFILLAPAVNEEPETDIRLVPSAVTFSGDMVAGRVLSDIVFCYSMLNDSLRTP